MKPQRSGHSERSQAILQRIRSFMVERDWKQFHNPKDLAIALSIESAELLEHFLWKTEEEVRERTKSHAGEIRDEVADVGIYLFELADVLGIDLLQAMSDKLDKNAMKYPVEKARGSNRKYTELEGA